MRFIVETCESVAGTYIVEADSIQEVHEVLSSMRRLQAGLDDGSVEQQEYAAFMVEVEHVIPLDAADTLLK